ncbi:Zinc finger, RING-type [Sesbania bispinosa]|nr:Zinc finger, RING-type [Sesbania bispinosa]
MESEALNVDDWIEEPFHRISEAMRRRARHRRRWRHYHQRRHALHDFPEPHVHDVPSEAWWRQFATAEDMSFELNHFLVNSGNGSVLQTGEGSVTAEERAEEVPKACDINNCGVTLDETSEKEEDVEKGRGNDGGFFDCNICLDLAKDPVVTCCGHLFCWPCVYTWLHLHSDSKECPVCKGEVTVDSVTPIYGRGNNARVPDEDSTLKIPLRPNARHVSEDSTLRQSIQRNVFTMPVEEMIRRLGSRLDLNQDLVQPNEHDNAPETGERASSLLSRSMAARLPRYVRREHNLGAAPPDDAVSLTQNSIGGSLVGDSRRVQTLLLRRMQAHRGTFSSTLSSAERLVEAYFHNNPLGRNREQPPPVEDRDSFSSIGAVINSESQVDTAVEIDSMVSLSTSTSRRRNDASRVSDVDSGDSRAPRRRRLN